MTLNLMQDMDSAFLACDLEEPISYTPKNGTAKTINAIVFRGRENRIALNIKQSGNDMARKFDIEIYVSRTDVPVVKENADTVELYKIQGDTMTTKMNVVGIVRMDQGAFRLGLA
jgi:hypothetical protein